MPGEHVTRQRALARAPSGTVTLSTRFKVAQPVAVPLTEFPATPGTPADVQSFHSAARRCTRRP